MTGENRRRYLWLWAEQGSKLLNRLIHAYPTHGLVIDREEAQELGLPTRLPDSDEAALLDRLALALIEFGTEQDLMALAGVSPKTVAAAQKVLDRIQENRKPTAPNTGRRRRRDGEGMAA